MCSYKNKRKKRLHFKFSPVGGDANQGWAAVGGVPPPAIKLMQRKFKMHPKNPGKFYIEE